MAGARLRELVAKGLSLADKPDDDDDLRLRKRMGVAAGYATVIAPLSVPVFAQGDPIAIVLAFALSAFSVANLLVLARTRRFERYVVSLITAGALFVPAVAWFGGGLTLGASGIVWAFLVPAYALLALGPGHAGRWFVVFVATVVGAALFELVFGKPVATEPYELQFASAVINVVAPLSIVFAMLLYSERRRREAEARSEELLTNAIPLPIARRLKRGEKHIADVYPETPVQSVHVLGYRFPSHVDGFQGLHWDRFDLR